MRLHCLKLKYLHSILFIAIATIEFLSSTSALCEDNHNHHRHGKRRQHSAHEHGIANLSLVFEDNIIQIELLLPAVNVTGFGHKPSSSEEKHRESESIKLLQETENLFVLTESAKCAVESAKVENAQGDTHDHGESEHSEYRALYELRCSKPTALTEVKLQLFKHFPSLTKIRANTVVVGKQRQLTLSRERNSIPVAQN